MPAPVLQFKRGNAGVAGTVPALRPGEPAISLNNFDFFIGIDTSVANNKFFGSHRYWGREDGTTSLRLKLVDKDGINYTAIKSPDSLAGIITYRLPETQGGVDTVLKNDGSGNLSWGTGIDFVGINTFTNTTDNTLGNPDTGAVQIDGGLGVNKNVTVGAGLSVVGQSYFIGTATFYGGTFISGSLTGTISTATRATTVDTTSTGTNTNYHLVFTDNATSTNGATMRVDAELLYNPNTNTLTVGTGVGITQFSGSVSTGTSTSSVPTSSAVIDYVGTQVSGIDLTLGLNADTGGPSTVNTSQTLTINGTASEVETSVSGQTVTVGLPDAVVVGTSLSAPTIRTNLIKSSDTNATAITISGDDVTIAGDLYVGGNTTQVNTTSLTVEDTLVELGMVDGSAPGSDLDKDLGLLFNYFSETAKKAAVFWDDSENRIVFADQVTESSGVLTVASNAYASIEIESLWVNDCAGQSQVITCTGSERFLQNITVDAGTF